MVRRVPASAQDLIELRVACVGNVDAGKSTILGVLTKGRLDDGRGRARVSLFRHKHEVETGRTSSVGMEIMGCEETSLSDSDPSDLGAQLMLAPGKSCPRVPWPPSPTKVVRMLRHEERRTGRRPPA